MMCFVGINAALGAVPREGTDGADVPAATARKKTSTPAPAARKTAGSAASPSTRKTASSTAPAAVRKSTATSTHRYASPWPATVDPTIGDSLAGEDPIVRQMALSALENVNGSVVVVDPNTGRILSMVNQKLALSSGFTPCSTIKPVVALAALREGIISPDTKVYVPNAGRIDLQDALARSNNFFFRKLGLELGYDRITQYASEFGFGEKAGLDIPDESPGVYPDGPPKLGGVGLMAFCGTAIEVTALQMAAIFSALANGGTLYALQYPQTPEEIAEFHPVVRRRLDDVAPYIPQIREGLEGTVLYGTGRLAYDPDFSIFAKTGTCSENGAHLGWFVSYGGEAQSPYVVVVLLRGSYRMHGTFASQIAGRFYHDLAQRDRTEEAGNEISVPISSGP